MKKLGAALLVIITIASLIGCSSEKKSSKTEKVKREKIVIGTLKGPTGMGMVKLMEDDSLNKSKVDYEFIIAGSPDELIGKIINNEVDIAAVPTNMASILYNKTKGDIQLVATNTLGSLYVLENGETVHSLEDINEIELSGKGATPDFILQYLLKENKLGKEEVSISYSTDHETLVSKMIQGEVKLGLLPEPYVTTALMKNKNLRVVVDINKEWMKKNKGTDLSMGVLITQRNFGENNKEEMKVFLKEYKKSIEFTNKNNKETADLIEKYGILPNKSIARKAIAKSNIVFISSNESKKSIEKLLNIYYDFNPISIGGKLPDDNFYYKD